MLFVAETFQTSTNKERGHGRPASDHAQDAHATPKLTQKPFFVDSALMMRLLCRVSYHLPFLAASSLGSKRKIYPALAALGKRELSPVVSI